MTSIISHASQQTSLDEALEKIRARISVKQNPEKLDQILDQLSQFPFGQFLICNNGGWNGDWTYKTIRRTTLPEPYDTELEAFLFTKAPTVLATRERFHTFQSLIEQHLHDGCRLASVPCGVMSDLLTLNVEPYKDFRLAGIDLDPASLELAKNLAEQQYLLGICDFYLSDAWHLDTPGNFNILTSNGLNIYETDDDRVIELYRSFHRAMAPQGLLITSFLTPPPSLGKACSWDFSQIDADDLQRQKKVMMDVLEATWACYRNEEETRAQLTAAGFIDILIVWGTSRMFPTVTAVKP